jgi:hypothetical protein
MAAAVYMRLKGDTAVVDLPYGRQRHNLEAPGIGQNWTWPVHEAVEASVSRYAVGAGAQHEVIGVSEDALTSGYPNRVGGHSLNRPGGADRHEGGGLKRPMSGVQNAGARRSVRGDNMHPIFGG